MKFYKLALENSATCFTEAQFMNELALESTMATNVIDFFRRSLPIMTNELKDYVSHFRTPDQEIDLTAIDSNYATSERHKLERYYTSWREVLVQVPEGFKKGEFLPYVMALNSIGSNLFEQTNKLISEYRFALSSIISNKEQRTSLKDLSYNYEGITSARSELEERIASFFESTTTSRYRLIDVLPRYSDSKRLIGETKQLARLVSIKQLTQIKTLVNETVSVLMVLENQITKGDMSDISPQVVKNIAQGAYELAKYIDSIAVFYYAGVSIITCVNLLFDKIKDFE